MKKLLLSLIAVPMMLLGFTSCSDDDENLPEVTMNVQISGGVQNPDDNKIYVTEGTPLVFESIEAIPTNHKKTTLGLTTYFLQGVPVAQTITVPFGATIETEGLQPGEYTLQIKTEVYQVDKAAAFMLLTYTMVVEADDTPDSGDEEATPGTSTATPDTQDIAEQ